MSNLVAFLLELSLELFGCESERGEVGGEGIELGVESFGRLGEDRGGGWEEVRDKVFLWTKEEGEWVSRVGRVRGRDGIGSEPL